jgi:aspartokinase
MDTEQFKKLLAEGKQDEARELLEQFLAEAVTPQEQGRAILALVSAHMEAQNTIDEEHLRILKNAAIEMSEINKRESKLSDAINLAKTRKHLQGE